jgi:hypothetical protein
LALSILRLALAMIWAPKHWLQQQAAGPSHR